MREKPSSRKNTCEIKCVICDKFTKNKCCDKHRFEVDSGAEKFLKMAKNQLDDVYNHISDWSDTHRLYGADLYYHSTCMRNYVRKTESIGNSDNMSNSNEVENLEHSSCQALEKVVASLTPVLISGTGITLSKVRDKVNQIMHPSQIRNYQVKSFLIQKLGEGIKFCSSTRKNKSFMFFSADLSADDIAGKVRSIGVIKDAAHILRKEIKSFTFGLKKSIVIYLIYKTHGSMERLKEMHKHVLQHYLTLIELPSILTTQKKKRNLPR